MLTEMVTAIKLWALLKQGIEKSQLTILQGLMKLRQICDSPAILNEEEKYPNHSIKLDELTREITENIGEHKALDIFPISRHACID